MQSNPWWRELCWKESNLSNISRLFRSVKWWQLKFHDEFKDHLGISLPLAVQKSLGQKIRLSPGNLRERCPRRFFHFRELPSLGCEGGDWVQGNPGTPLTHPLEFSADSTPGTPCWLHCEKHQGGITPPKKNTTFVKSPVSTSRNSSLVSLFSSWSPQVTGLYWCAMIEIHNFMVSLRVSSTQICEKNSGKYHECPMESEFCDVAIGFWWSSWGDLMGSGRKPLLSRFVPISWSHDIPSTTN